MQSTSPSATSMGSANRFNYLPEDFVPGEFDVVCGRGKKCYSHVGNEHFRHRVLSMLGEYSKARSKLDKSSVLSDVVEQVRQASPGGGFVKQDDKGRWFEVRWVNAYRSPCIPDALSQNLSSRSHRLETSSLGRRPRKRSETPYMTVTSRAMYQRKSVDRKSKRGWRISSRNTSGATLISPRG